MKVNAKNLQLLSSVFLVSVALNVTVKWHNERWFRREIRHTLCALPIFLLRKMLLRSNLNDTRHYVRSMIQQCSFEMCLRLLFCKEFFNFFGCDYLYFVICVMCTNVLSGESLLRFCSTSNETILKFDSMSFVRRKESRKRIFCQVDFWTRSLIATRVEKMASVILATQISLRLN